MSKVTRPALRYYGSKWNLAPWIIKHMETHEVYVEPFGGSAAVLLRKERSLIEVYNDLDREVVNFFYVLRKFPERLMEMIALTPFSLDEFEMSFSSRGWAESYIGENRGWEVPLDEEHDWHVIDRIIEAARMFYLRSHLGMAGPTASDWTGFRRQKKFSRGKDGTKSMTPAAVSFMRTSHLRPLAERLRGVTIDCLDGLECIRRYDAEKTLFYVDPPYPRGVRRRSGEGYQHELSDADHEALLDLLRRVKGMVVLSGYASELYDDTLAGWERYERRARVDGEGTAVEVLWVKGNEE